jgi:putative toxin-antitoxin system antitoxin component (TIGR02293 family)
MQFNKRTLSTNQRVLSVLDPVVSHGVKIPKMDYTGSKLEVVMSKSATKKARKAVQKKRGAKLGSLVRHKSASPARMTALAAKDSLAGVSLSRSGLGIRREVTPSSQWKVKVKPRPAKSSPEKTLVHLREGFGVTKEQMADVLGLTKTSYGRREAGAELEPVEAHRVDHLAKTLMLAQQVFHTEEAAREWFHSEIPSLASETPLGVMSEPGGLDRVHNVLQRIYYGGY